jgi:hypothetical protein
VWRERKNKKYATIICLSLTSVSTCFGHHYVPLQENKDRVTAFGVLLCSAKCEESEKTKNMSSGNLVPFQIRYRYTYVSVTVSNTLRLIQFYCSGFTGVDLNFCRIKTVFHGAYFLLPVRPFVT